MSSYAPIQQIAMLMALAGCLALAFLLSGASFFEALARARLSRPRPVPAWMRRTPANDNHDLHQRRLG